MHRKIGHVGITLVSYSIDIVMRLSMNLLNYVYLTDNVIAILLINLRGCFNLGILIVADFPCEVIPLCWGPKFIYKRS